MRWKRMLPCQGINLFINPESMLDGGSRDTLDLKGGQCHLYKANKQCTSMPKQSPVMTYRTSQPQLLAHY